MPLVRTASSVAAAPVAQRPVARTAPDPERPKVHSQTRYVVKYTSDPFRRATECDPAPDGSTTHPARHLWRARMSIRANKANFPACGPAAAAWKTGPGPCAPFPRVIRLGETPGTEGTGMGFRQQMPASTQVRHATPAFAAGLAGTQL